MAGQLFDRGGRGGVDLFHGPLIFRLGVLLRLVDQLVAGLLGVAAALVEDGADLILRGGQLALVVGQDFAGLLVGRFGLGDLVGDVSLPLVEPLGDRLPSELPQDRQQAEEDDGGPDGQIALSDVQRMDSPSPPAARRPAGGGHASDRSAMPA